ncbi:33526_t:CDS:2, partial [Racocetra persica]
FEIQVIIKKILMNNLSIFDTHCHLVDKEYYQQNLNTKQIIQAAAAAGVKYILNVGYDKESNQKVIEQLKEFPKKQLTNQKIIAIGEIGLDYYRTFTDIDKQKYWFKRQLELAKKYDLPVLLHIREAFANAYEIVKESEIKKGQVIEKIPLERIVIETDAPYLTPEPFRGRINYPQNIIHTLTKIAEIKKMDVKVAAEKIYLNTLR